MRETNIQVMHRRPHKPSRRRSFPGLPPPPPHAPMNAVTCHGVTLGGRGEATTHQAHFLKLHIYLFIIQFFSEFAMNKYLPQCLSPQLHLGAAR